MSIPMEVTIRWEMPEPMIHAVKGVTKVNNTIQSVKSELDTVSTPKLNGEEVSWLRGVLEADYTNPDRTLSTIIDNVDRANYHMLDNFQITEYAYRAAVYGVSSVVNPIINLFQ